MIVTAIDPGATQSAIVQWDGSHVLYKAILDNETVEQFCAECNTQTYIEQLRGFGMKVGNEVLDACWWSGIFYVRTIGQAKMVPRKTVITHLCGHSRGGDKDVRDALTYRFGSPGTKKVQGKLYGVVNDMWSALALAVYAVDVEVPK